jgi:hypothetical protein
MPIDTEYKLWDKETWNRPKRLADIRAQLEAEVARDMNKRRAELQFTADVQRQRDEENRRFDATEAATARKETFSQAQKMLELQKEAKQQEENLKRERARQGLVEVEKDVLNQPGSTTGAGGFRLPSNVIPALSEIRAGRNMRKADAAETIEDTIRTEKGAGAAPLAKILSEISTMTAATRAKTESKKADVDDAVEPALSLEQKVAAIEKARKDRASAAYERENVGKPSPDTAADIASREKIAAMNVEARKKESISLDGISGDPTKPAAARRIKLNTQKAAQGTVAEPVTVSSVATPTNLPPTTDNTTSIPGRPSIPNTDSAELILQELYRRAKENNFNVGRLQ